MAHHIPQIEETKCHGHLCITAPLKGKIITVVFSGVREIRIFSFKMHVEISIGYIHVNLVLISRKLI